MRLVNGHGLLEVRVNKRLNHDTFRLFGSNYLSTSLGTGLAYDPERIDDGDLYFTSCRGDCATTTQQDGEQAKEINMTSRTVSKNQKPREVLDSRIPGMHVFSIQGVESKGENTQDFALEGEQRPSKDEAGQSAWEVAKAWVAEIGEVTETDTEYMFSNNG
jgi:hypothetical protein